MLECVVYLILVCLLLILLLFFVNNKGTCSPNGALRLTGGNNTYEGVLEYCYNGHWSIFCSLDVEEAIVACKQLGYEPYASKIVCVYKVLFPRL